MSGTLGNWQLLLLSPCLILCVFVIHLNRKGGRD